MLQGGFKIGHPGVPSNLLVHCPWVFAFFPVVLDGSSSHLPSSQGKGKWWKMAHQRTCDSHSQLTGHLITPGAREVGKLALNSECIQPKFRVPLPKIRQSKGLRTPEIIYSLYKYLLTCILLRERGHGFLISFLKEFVLQGKLKHLDTLKGLKWFIECNICFEISSIPIDYNLYRKFLVTSGLLRTSGNAMRKSHGKLFSRWVAVVEYQKPIIYS